MGSRHRQSSPRVASIAGFVVFAFASLTGGSACTDILGIGDRTLAGSSAGGAGGATTTTTTTSMGGTTTTTTGQCAGDPDCANSPDGPYCDPVTLLCVECVPSGTNTCAGGLYCEGGGECAIGCNVNADCNPTVAYGLECNQPIHRCTGCDATKLCPPGTKCDAGTCVPGCDASDDCPTVDWQCCTGQCLHTSKDIAHCGSCDHECLNPDQTIWKCVEGECIGQGCKNGWKDCNDNITEQGGGCEANLATDPSNCGACDNPCKAENGAPGCSAGMCTVMSCTTPYKDCNVDASDGCEANLLSDVDNCGTCGNECNSPGSHATFSCSDGACAVTSCDMDWANCNLVADDGCECPSGAGGAGGGTGGVAGSGGGVAGSGGSGGGTAGSGGLNMGGSNVGGMAGGSGGMGGAGGGTTGTDTGEICQSAAGVLCGQPPAALICVMGEGCCISGGGATTCSMMGLCPPNNVDYLCDDRLDCGVGMECCKSGAGGSTCVMAGACAIGSNTRLCSSPSAGALSCQCNALTEQCCPPKAGGKDPYYSTCQPQGQCK